METHSRILARMIPWTERAGRLQSLESQRLKGLSTHTHTHTHTHTELQNQSCCRPLELSDLDSLLGSSETSLRHVSLLRESPLPWEFTCLPFSRLVFSPLTPGL